MLSKSRGQVLRVAAVLHVLFCFGKDTLDVPDTVTDAAVTAITNFIQVACQQTAYIAGRGLLSEEVQKFSNGGTQLFSD